MCHTSVTPSPYHRHPSVRFANWYCGLIAIIQLMIYGHDYHVAPGLSLPGPPTVEINECTPLRIQAWADQETSLGKPPSAQETAGERRVRTWGFGSKRWDPNSSSKLPQGWIRDIDERQQARESLLHDINDLVSTLLLCCCILT
jgi:hypothetical protein